MNKKIMLIVMVLSSLVAQVSGTDAVLKQALRQEGGDKTVFQTVVQAAKRYPEAQYFMNIVRRAGLQHALNNYGGKKEITGKKNQVLLPLIPQNQQLTLLIPINSALSDFNSRMKVHSKATRAQARALIEVHVLKGAFMQANLKGQIDTLGGTKINADNLQFYKTDIVAGNGVIHLIKTLAAQPVAQQQVVAQSAAAQSVMAPAVAQPAATTPVAPVVSAAPAVPADDAIDDSSDSSDN